MTALKPIQAASMRRSLTDAQKQAESRYAKEEIKPTPETVSATSSTHAIFSEVGVKNPTPKDADMMAGMKHDVVCIDPRVSWMIPRLTHSRTWSRKLSV